MNIPHRLSAPRQHGAILAEPALGEVGPILVSNRRRLRSGRSILGRSFEELRREARQTATAAARQYLHDAGEPVPSIQHDSLLLAGHQPELFHPGVWIKNFALQGLARRHSASALNLIVDNDTVKSAGLQLPAVRVPFPPLDESHPHLAAIPFDRWTHETPYEECQVQDETLFRTLPERARQEWGFTPLLDDFWKDVVWQVGRTLLLGERFAAARRSWERRWGCHNLELPVSRLCQTTSFAWFACHLLTELPRLHAIYNGSVHDYRRRYGMRSRHHPVPDLATEGEWREAPLWAWREGQRRRGRLMVRAAHDALLLRVGEEKWPTLPTAPEALLKAWHQLEADGFKVRSRALTNTIYARLFLGDLFIHGIGGAKYDELTDQIIERFYEIEPPQFIVLSGTLLLPLPTYPVTRDEVRRQARHVRKLIHNPQRHQLPEDRDAMRLVEEKQKWIDRQPATRPERRERFRELRRITEAMRTILRDEIEATERRLAECEQQVRANAVLQRRDYAFCLYPESMLRPFCEQFYKPRA